MCRYVLLANPRLCINGITRVHSNIKNPFIKSQMLKRGGLGSEDGTWNSRIVLQRAYDHVQRIPVTAISTVPSCAWQSIWISSQVYNFTCKVPSAQCALHKTLSLSFEKWGWYNFYFFLIWRTLVTRNCWKFVKGEGPGSKDQVPEVNVTTICF
jgi:hypothetical protein